MHIGIDIGGTFTDGVILDKNKLVRYAKIPTDQDIAWSIQEVLEQLISYIDKNKIERLVLSTTLITNLLTQGKQEPVGLIILPGPGVNPDSLKIIGQTLIIHGAVDYRGRIIETIDQQEIKKAIEKLLKQGIKHIGAACKFCQRNPSLEEQIESIVLQEYPQVNFLKSSDVHGLLNWVRRANGTVYQLMIANEYQMFIEKIKATLTKFNLTCPVFVLKADGGTLPLDISAGQPLESIYSGPAASMLGALAASGEELTAVGMDIGGTTTDLGLILEGRPLMASSGAVLNGYPIPCRALAVSSLPLGGDTSLAIKNGKVCLEERKGPAYCLNGPTPTITDALVYLGLSDLGDKDLAISGIELLAAENGFSPKHLAEEALELFISILEEKLTSLFEQWEEEPAYRVWQLMSKNIDRPRKIVCIGGPAKGLGKLWGQKKGWEVIIPEYASVANAIGAALSKTTLRLDFYADTQQKIYSTNIGGMHGKLAKTLINIDDAKKVCLELFQDISNNWGVTEEQREILYEESFNIIRDWSTVGKIFQIGIQTIPGLKAYLSKEGIENE